MQTFDPERAVAHLRGLSGPLVDIIEQVGPFTLEPEAQGFATLVDAIVSQQISVKAAAAIMNRLVLTVGDLTPQALLAFTPELLRSVGLSNQKARYVLDLAVKVADGVVRLDALPQFDDEEIIAQLIQVKGIGRWTAEMYLIFALGRPDVLPVADLGLRQGMQRAYVLAALPDAQTMTALAEPWRPYRSVATWYLWRSLGNTPAIAPS
ncbi:MAG: DNA-3-methyladenine glycosylase [Chloroflexales bacterium]|nr:DNA-3-methyladenine glycosylase [Chloroflexales bacterium]